MNIPNATVPYILYQRTNYLRIPAIPLLGRLPIEWMVRIESVLRRKEVKDAFIADIQSEIDSVRAYLPAHVENLLDIGFGIGGIDVLLYDAVKPKKMFLIDKNKTDPVIWYGFEKQGAAYNSLRYADQLLHDNGIPASAYALIDIDTQPFPDETFDLIVSFISWGFHYPIQTYLEQVKKALSAAGVLIVDVRKGTGGEELLRNAFASVTVIQDMGKSKRLACKHA